MGRGNNAPNIPPREPAAWTSESPSKRKYFHPHLTTMELVKSTMLPHIKQNGSFLVRISTSQKDTYTVSVVHNNHNKHIKILKKLNQYYLQDELFPTIDSLIAYYGTHEVPNFEGITGILLRFPISNEQAGSFKQRRPNSGTDTTSACGRIIPKGPSAKDGPELEFRAISTRTSNSHKLPPLPGQVGATGDVFAPSSSSSTWKRTESKSNWKSSTMNHPGRTRSVRSDNMDERPPAPLPEEADTGHNGIYNGVYYSCVKGYDRNKLPELMEALNVAGNVDETFCECGLDLELSQLPQGWSVHVSREPDAGYGRPFFMSPDQVTSWDLPRDIYLELNRHQQKFILYLCDNYKNGNDPPDKITQLQWSSTSSSNSLKDAVAMIEASGAS